MTDLQNQHPGINIAHADGKDEQQAGISVFGFWTFLMSDAILFSLLFATYASMTGRTDGGPSGATLFDIGSAFSETMVLLVSSLCFGLASAALKEGNVRRLYLWLSLSLALGLVFIGLEARELNGLMAQGAGPQRSGFLSSFFLLVSTHGLHVAAGSIWIIIMMIQIARFGLNKHVRSRLLRLGLFWHFLDLVWIGIFSVVYLPAVAA